MDLETTRYLVNSIDQNEIPETFYANRNVDSKDAIDQLVTDWTGLKQSAFEQQKAQTEADLEAWIKVKRRS